MLGNILIVLVLIFFGSLANLLQKPMPSGDYGVGYSFALLIYGAGFIISTGLLAWNMNLNHCFDWLPASLLRYRNLLIFFGWIAFVISIIFSLGIQSNKVEKELPLLLTWFTWSKIYIWLPLLMLIPCLYLINVEQLRSVLPNVYKIPLTIALGLSFFVTLSFLFVILRLYIQKEIALNKTVEDTKIENLRKYGTKDPSWALESSMNSIINYKEKTIAGLLLYTLSDNSHRDKAEAEKIRHAAIAKIKSYENWEADLIDILEEKEEGSLYNVYGFLEGNTIEHREKFILPIKNSITRVTSVTQKSIKDPDNLYLGSTNIVALCHILDTQFKDNAAEFRPSLLTLQQVLDTTPAKRSDKKYAEGFNDILQKSRMAVKNWLDVNP